MTSINKQRQIAGWVLAPDLLHPFVWAPNTRIRDLIDELPADVRDNPYFWLAAGINDAGQVVVSESSPLADPFLLTSKMQVALNFSNNPSHVVKTLLLLSQ